MKSNRGMARGPFVAMIAAISLLLMTGVAAWFERAPPRIDGPSIAAGQDLQADMRTGNPTVVEFGANACASCREMKVILARLRQVHGDRYAVLEVDLLGQQEVARRHRIRLMPTQVFFDANGRETDRHMGKLSFEDLVQRLEKAGAIRP